MHPIDRRHILSGVPSSLVAVGGTSASPAAGLTLHVLDTRSGKPAAGVRVELSVLENGVYRPLRQVHTNAEGRNQEMLLDSSEMKTGKYQLIFHVGAYFKARDPSLAEPLFLEQAVIQFGISDPLSHYHIPLLASPWSFTTYRGS